VRGAIGVARPRAHPDNAVAHLDRSGRHVVGPGIERAAARKIEPRVVPMTSQDAFLDRAAMQWKAHVRAAVIEREDAALLVHDEERAARAVRHDHALRGELCERADADELRVGGALGHGSSLAPTRRPHQTCDYYLLRHRF